MICILRNECNERSRRIIVMQLYASVNMQLEYDDAFARVVLF